MQPMIASDATAQCAAPCRLDHAQLQLAGCDVRLCREPAVQRRQLCQHRAARHAGGRPERGNPLFARDFGTAGRLRSAPPPIAVSTLSRATLARYLGIILLVLIASNLRVGITRADIAFSLAMSLGFNLLLGVNDLLGPGMLFAFVAGRYYHPRREERILLFVDMRASTSIAERLGEERFLHFLNRFITDLSLAIAEAGGEIHKYVGDEIIATWTLAAGLTEAACVRACFAALDRLAARGPAYERDLGCRADFRAGLHCGSVVVGELGYLKKEIALIGDSMNTAARIQEACRATGCRVLASAALMERRASRRRGGSLARPLPMRGREQSIVLYALETVDGAE